MAARIRAKVALRIELADRWARFGSQAIGLPGSEKVGCSRSDDRCFRNFWRLPVDMTLRLDNADALPTDPQPLQQQAI